MGSSRSLTNGEPILILFDGVCNLCNGLVRFIIKRDPSGKFKFASLQSEFGRSQLVKFNLPLDILYSLIVIDNGKAMERSDAALHIAKHLGIPWNFFSLFKVFPKSFRDAVYNFIGRHRYSVFGKAEHCMIPAPGIKDRFLD